MSKATKKQAIECNDHQFQLIPLASDLYFKQPVKQSFCKSKEDPKYKSGNKRSKKGKKSCICFPIFNQDCNYATSAFILPEQKKNYLENQAKYKQQHECRIKQYSDEKSQMLIPKPKTKQSYCNVCRTNYEDYLLHIKSDYHRSSIKRASFSKHIKDFQIKYDKLNQGRNSNSKFLYNNDTTQNITQSDQQVQFMGMPCKKVKKDLNFAPTIYYPFQFNSFNNFTDMATVAQIPAFNASERQIDRPTLPISFFNYEIEHQNNQNLMLNTSLNNQMMPIRPPINCLPVNCGAEYKYFYCFPMVCYNYFQGFQNFTNMPLGQQITNVQGNI